MSRAFTRELASDEDEEEGADPALRLPQGTRNYITPGGHARIRAELEQLLRVERPQVVSVVQWAASNGDRSENADYIYGKRRLREIDRRIRFLTRRLDQAEIVDPARRANTEQVFFGATVTICDEQGLENHLPDCRRGRDRFCPWTHQLGVAAGASAAQVARRRQRAFSEPGRLA
jgi:transcription elongation factor GreB